MSDYTVVNLREVENMAERRGTPPSNLESRFARTPLEMEKAGITYFRLGPGWRFPFGHRHREQEEVFVVVTGSARIKVEDDVVELGPWDAVRIAPTAARGIEGGAEGAEMLVFGAPSVRDDVEMLRGWWED